VTASSVDMLMSYWVHPYRPRLRLEIDKARELMRFGRWISWFRAVGFATSELPGLVVAKAVGVHPLGQFQMARQLGVLPPVTLGIHMHGVMFPALAGLTSEAQRERAFLRALSALGTVTIAFAAAVTVFGPRLIDVGLGPQWTGMATSLQILVWAGGIRALTVLNNAFLMAMGRPQLDFHASVPNAVILTTLLYPAGVRFGIVGVSVVMLVGSIVTCICQLTILNLQAGIELRALARALWRGVLVSMPIFGVVILPEQGFAATLGAATIATLASVVLLVKSLQVSFTGSVADGGGVKG
jgi:lipopolysaccharide exporter